eukprot:gene19120-30976_t
MPCEEATMSRELKLHLGFVLDEAGCATTATTTTRERLAGCVGNVFICADLKLCILKRYTCNGFNDCSDGSDEVGTTATNTTVTRTTTTATSTTATATTATATSTTATGTSTTTTATSTTRTTTTYTPGVCNGIPEKEFCGRDVQISACSDEQGAVGLMARKLCPTMCGSCVPTTSTTTTTTPRYKRQTCNGVTESVGCGTRIALSDCTVTGELEAYAKTQCQQMCGLGCTTSSTTATGTETTVTATSTTKTGTTNTVTTRTKTTKTKTTRTKTQTTRKPNTTPKKAAAEKTTVVPVVLGIGSGIRATQAASWTKYLTYTTQSKNRKDDDKVKEKQEARSRPCGCCYPYLTTNGGGGGHVIHIHDSGPQMQPAPAPNINLSVVVNNDNDNGSDDSDHDAKSTL